MREREREKERERERKRESKREREGEREGRTKGIELTRQFIYLARLTEARRVRMRVIDPAHGSEGERVSQRQRV